MRKLISLILFLATICVGISSAEWVSGYMKANGTYVQGYYRTSKNSIVEDNFSYKPKTYTTYESLYETPKPKKAKNWWDD